MSATRYGHTATLLPGGQVLVAGGQDQYSSPLNSAEIYNPAATPTPTWTLTTPLVGVHGAHTATLLPSGGVLIGFGVGADTLSEIFVP